MSASVVFAASEGRLVDLDHPAFSTEHVSSHQEIVSADIPAEIVPIDDGLVATSCSPIAQSGLFDRKSLLAPEAPAVRKNENGA